MHMADALLSPTVGATMWAATAGAIAWCSKKVREELDERKVPLMGVLAAFLFAAQMINFTIPATGSSGHLGGGLLLAVLLGPYAAFLAIASVLFIQALFFADGGLLALGCNIFNLGVFPCFVAYPLIYKPLVGREPAPWRLMAAAIVAAVVGLQLGSFAVVLETVASGVSALPFGAFVALMQPIHLGIGIVEGMVSAAVIAFVWRARPEVLQSVREARPIGAVPMRNLLIGFVLATLLTGGLLSWFASEHPDGLEWAITGVTGSGELPEAEHGVHGFLAALQEKLAFLPDYSLPAKGGNGEGGGKLGTSVSGVVGGLITLALCAVVGVLLKRRGRKSCPPH
jgi:cobalt/nickel transport system permease protein